MKSIQSMAFAAVICLLVMSCDKKAYTRLDTTSANGLTNLKIIHASAYTTNYSVQLKVNDVRVSNNITNATPFPGGGLNTGGASSPWYLSLPSGTTKITLSVPKLNTNTDSIFLFSGTVGLDFNKYYSAYLTDTSTRTQLVLLNEDVTLPGNNLSRFKFVNLMPNQLSLDLYWGSTKVASNVQYTTASPTFLLNRADTARWYIRPAGAAPTSGAISVYPVTAPTFAAPFSVPNRRLFTVFARGYNGGTGNKVPAISLLYN